MRSANSQWVAVMLPVASLLFPHRQICRLAVDAFRRLFKMLPVDPQTGRVASPPVLRLALLVNVGLQKTEERRRKREEKGARRGEESGRRGSAGLQSAPLIKTTSRDCSFNLD